MTLFVERKITLDTRFVTRPYGDYSNILADSIVIPIPSRVIPVGAYTHNRDFFLIPMDIRDRLKKNFKKAKNENIPLINRNS